MSKMGDRVRVIRDNYRMAAEHDPKLGWLLAGILVLGLGVFITIGVLTKNLLTWLIIGIPLIALALAIVFSRRAMRSAYKSIDGKPGAAVAVIQNMKRGGWTVTPAVAANKNGDFIHRAVGRAGVILIGEGGSPTLPGLLASERKRTARFVAEIPIQELVVGNAEGQVPIAKLDKHLRKLPKVLAPGEVTTLSRRLEALGSAPLPIPKGPVPKSGRIPRGGKLR